MTHIKGTSACCFSTDHKKAEFWYIRSLGWMCTHPKLLVS